MANISLADLTREAEKNGSVVTPATQKKPTNPGNVVSISATDMAKKLNVNAPKEELKNQPVVDIGFGSLAATVQDIKKGSEIIAERNREKVEEQAYDEFEKELMGEEESAGKDKDELDLDGASTNETYVDVERTNTSDVVNTSIPVVDVVATTPEAEVIETQDAKVNKNTKNETKEDEELTEIKIDDFDDLLSELEDDGYVDVNGNEDDDFEKEEEDADEVRQRMADTVDKEIRDKLFVNKFDPTKLRISKKPTSVSMALNYHTTNKATADFPLYYTKHCSKFKECTGTELQTLQTKIDASNEITSVIEAVRFNYEHVVDPNKPATFEAWAKMVRTEDVEAMYFGVYKATYFSSNLIPVTCNHCNTSNLIKVNVNDMVKPLNDDVKKEMDKLFQQDTTSPYPKVEGELIQVSDRLFAMIKPPSVYDAFVQFATISPENQRKYQLILNLISCIESFYFLNNEGELSPIEIKADPTNIRKTVTRKVRDYGSLIKGLTADQYATFITKINSLMEDAKVSFIIPEVECPKCHKKIPSQPINSMLQILFTRAQLAQIKNT